MLFEMNCTEPSHEANITPLGCKLLNPSPQPVWLVSQPIGGSGWLSFTREWPRTTPTPPVPLPVGRRTPTHVPERQKSVSRSPTRKVLLVPSTTSDMRM